MIRRVSVIVPLLALVGWLAAAPSASGSALVAQDEAEAAQETAPPVFELGLGERYGLEGWELEVQNVFIEESPDRFGYDEVRVAVAYRTIGEVVPYRFDSLTGAPGFPELQLRDGAGHVWEIPVTNPGANLYPGSAITTLDGVPAHWTIGFDVPTPATDRMAVEAVWLGNVVASWDLNSAPATLAGWTAPATAFPSEFGDPISWSGNLEVVPTGHGILACGNPERERVTTAYVVTATLENLGDRDVYFPDVRYPDVPAFAVWTDGSSARYSVEGGYFDDDLGIEPDPLDARNREQVIIPPRTASDRAWAFYLPRDSRLTDVEELPAWLLLQPPSGEPLWIDLAGIDATELDDTFCAGIQGGEPFQIGAPETVPTTTTTTPGEDV